MTVKGEVFVCVSPRRSLITVHGNSVICGVRAKLGLMRKAVLDIRHWCRQRLSSVNNEAMPGSALPLRLRSIIIQEKSVLVSAYLIWIFSQKFRRVATADSAHDRTRALQLHEEVLRLNAQARTYLRHVRPVEMKTRIAEVLELDRIAISIGAHLPENR